MSLKAFHIVFIVICILFSFGMGTWAANAVLSGEGGKTEIVMASVFFVSGVALLFYARYVLKKLKNINYL
jgi:hypothetical protein